MAGKNRFMDEGPITKSIVRHVDAISKHQEGNFIHHSNIWNSHKTIEIPHEKLIRKLVKQK